MPLELSRGRAVLTGAAVAGVLAAGVAPGGPAVAAEGVAAQAVAGAEPVAARTAATTPGAADRDADRVRVEVTTLLPRAPQPTDTVVQVAGRLVNTGPVPVEALTVRLAVGGVVRSRSGLALQDASPSPGRPRGEAAEPAVTELAPGAATSFDLRVPLSALRLSQLGVYPLQVQVRGRSDGRGPVGDLGDVTTFLPWFPAGPPVQSRLAFVWPFVAAPARAPDDALLDEDVARALQASLEPATGREEPGSAPAPDDERPGRLAALLEAAVAGAPGGCDAVPGPAPSAQPAPTSDVPAPPCRADPVPLTLAVDPELLETVDALSRSHLVAVGAERRQQPPVAAAGRWLATLRDALGEAQLLALPYADPDVVALSRAGSALRDDVEQLRVLGHRVAADLTGVEPLDSVAWPPPGRLSSAALDATLAGGATAVVLGEDALPRRQSDGGRTPGARTALSSASAGQVSGLVVDERLSSLLTATPDDPGWQGARLAEQRWLAETAIVAAERPGEARTFVVAPPRRAAVHPQVGAEALRDAGRLPWLCPVALSDVVAGTERCPGAAAGDAVPVTEDRGDLAPPAEQPDAVLSPSYLAQVADVRARGSQLTEEVLVPGTDAAAAVKARFLRARARAESSAWRRLPALGRRVLALYRDDVDAHRDQVSLSVPRDGQLLTSDSGVIDLTVSNALDQPVTVGVQLNDPVEARLTSTDTGVRTVGPEEVVPVRLRVQARTSGQFVVRATLLDRSGQPFGAPAELVVRSTRFGRLALGITGVGAGVLLAAAGVRIARRAWRRQLAGPDED